MIRYEREQRTSHRIAVELPIQLTLGDNVWSIHTWDISDNGVYIAMDESDSEAIELHAEVTIQLIGTNYQTPILSATVVRKTPRGIAIKLTGTVTSGDASELMLGE